MAVTRPLIPGANETREGMSVDVEQIRTRRVEQDYHNCAWMRESSFCPVGQVTGARMLLHEDHLVKEMRRRHVWRVRQPLLPRNLATFSSLDSHGPSCDRTESATEVSRDPRKLMSKYGISIWRWSKSAGSRVSTYGWPSSLVVASTLPKIRARRCLAPFGVF